MPYASTPHAFDRHHESTAMMLAAHAAVAMKGSKVQNQLRTALETRDIIGQAKGILMEGFKIGDGYAFDLLVTVSQHTHRKLSEIADERTRTGDRPTG